MLFKKIYKKNVATRLAASLKRDVNPTNWPTKRESWKDKKYFLEANHRNYVREEQRKLTHDPSFIQSSMLPFPVHKNWKLNQTFWPKTICEGTAHKFLSRKAKKGWQNIKGILNPIKKILSVTIYYYYDSPIVEEGCP